MSCSNILPPMTDGCSAQTIREIPIEIYGRTVYRDRVKYARVVLETPEKYVCAYRGKNRYAKQHHKDKFIELYKIF